MKLGRVFRTAVTSSGQPLANYLVHVFSQQTNSPVRIYLTEQGARDTALALNTTRTDGSGAFSFYAAEGQTLCCKVYDGAGVVYQEFDLQPGVVSDAQVTQPLATKTIATVLSPQGAFLDGDTVFVRGRSIPGDGGGGHFMYSASSTAFVDEGIVFSGPGGVGRFLRDGYTVFGFNGTIDLAWYGGKPNGTTDNVPYYETLVGAASAVGARVHLGPGTWYFATTLNLDGAAHTQSDMALLLDEGAVIQLGPGANPGIYCKSDRCRIEGGEIRGNLQTAGAYPTLFSEGHGITSGSTTATFNASYLAGHTGTVVLAGLGTGWVTRGTPMDVKVGTTYYRYFVTDDAQITAGSATVQLNRALQVDTASGSLAYLKNYGNRLFLAANYAAGTSTISIQSPDVSANVSPQLMPGDQFVLHTNNNDIDTLDFTTIYTVMNTVPFTGSYPTMTAANVVISPPLAGNATKGQMVSSIQDHRNNKYTTVLFYGTDGCSVQGVTLKDYRCHAVMFNATINSPWDGTDPRSEPNTNWKILRCAAVGGGVGTMFGGAHASDFEVAHNIGKAAVKFNGAQFEHSKEGQVHHNNFDGLKEGIQVTGRASDVQVTNNTVTNCGTLINLRNITYRMTCAHNTLVCGPTTVFAIRAEAGYRPLTANEDTSNTLALIQGNLISGSGLLSGTYNGSAIIVQPNQTDPTVNASLRPHFVKVVDNTIYRPARHGIHVVAGAQVDVLDNTVLLAGYNGIREEQGSRVSTIGNTVVDAGQTVPSAGFYLAGVAGGWFDKNRALRIMGSSPQTYGLETDGTCTVMIGLNELDGSAGKYSGVTGLTGVALGLGALRSGALVSVGVGIEAGRLATGTNGTFVGPYAGKTVTTGNDNTCIGTQSGAALLATGNRNTLLGADTDANNVNQGIALGYRAIARRNGELAIGDDSNVNPVLTAATAGAVASYLDVRVNGQTYKIPLHASS